MVDREPSSEKLLEGFVYGIDLDDSAFQTLRTMVPEINGRHKLDLRFGDFDLYLKTQAVLEAQGDSEAQAREKARAVWNDQIVLENVLLMPGVQENIRILRKNGGEGHAITSRLPELWLHTEHMVEYYLPELMGLHMRSDEDQRTSKVDDMNRLGVKLMYEDNMDEIILMTKYTDSDVVVVPRPYNINRDFDHPRVLRFFSDGDYDDIESVYRLSREWIFSKFATHNVDSSHSPRVDSS